MRTCDTELKALRSEIKCQQLFTVITQLICPEQMGILDMGIG